MLSEGDGRVGLAAAMMPTTAKPAELDAVMAGLERSRRVRSATWTASAMP